METYTLTSPAAPTLKKSMGSGTAAADCHVSKQLSGFHCRYTENGD